MRKTRKIFTPEAIVRIRKMKQAGADDVVMALAVGSKNVNSFRSRTCQLGVFREQPAEDAA